MVLSPRLIRNKQFLSNQINYNTVLSGLRSDDMRVIYIFTIATIFLLTACNSIPNKEQQNSSAESLYFKGIQYLSGNNVKKNESKAIQYFKIASNKGYAPADNALAVMYDEGISVKTNKNLALQYYEKAALANDISAQYNLAAHYHENDPTNENARKYLEQAIENNDSDALNLQAQISLKNGDYQKAYQSFLQSATHNNSTALFYLYLMNQSGIGTHQNNKTAFQLLQKSASLGHPEALFTLGSMYLTGNSVQKNPTKAFHILQEAATLGHVKATVNTAIMLAKGEGTQQDLQKSVELFHLSAQNGDKYAQEVLKNLNSQHIK